VIEVLIKGTGGLTLTLKRDLISMIEIGIIFNLRISNCSVNLSVLFFADVALRLMLLLIS
jgi:hypothetical protein